MTAKEYLRRYRTTKMETQQLKEQIEEIEAVACSPSVSKIKAVVTSGGGSSDSVLNAVAKIEELSEDYRQKFCELVETQTRIETALEVLEPIERILIREYYFAGKNWENVAEKIGYSWRHVHRIHANALQKISI